MVDARPAASSGPGRARPAPAKPSRRAARPPVTQVPPPNGTTATWCSTAQARTAATSSCEPGRTTASGASDRSPARARSRSGVDLPRVRSRRVVVVGEHVLGAEDAAQRRRAARRRAPTAGTVTGVERPGSRSSPKASSIRPRAESGRAAARPGRPSAGGASRPAASSVVMCYSVTHDVTSSQPRRDVEQEPRDAYLDAARDCILDVGWRRTTLTEVARRAGVSRMTIYRTWARHADAARRPDDPRVGRRRRPSRSADGGPADPARSPTRSSAPSGSCAQNELFVRIVELDPELILPYLFSRRGRSQELILALTADGDRRGPGGRRDPRGQPGRHRARRCCSPPTASCSRCTRWSTTSATEQELDAELRHPDHEDARSHEHPRSRPASPARPPRSTSSSSASASPAPASPSTRSPAACRCWPSTPTTWRSARRAGRPSSCTAGCATSPPARSASPTRARSSAAS